VEGLLTDRKFLGGDGFRYLEEKGLHPDEGQHPQVAAGPGSSGLGALRLPRVGESRVPKRRYGVYGRCMGVTSSPL